MGVLAASDAAKPGFIRQERLEEKTAPPAKQDFRAVLPMRETRATRHSLPQRLAQQADEPRQWLDAKLGIEQKPAVAEKISHTESVKQNIEPNKNRKPTLREQAERSIQAYQPDFSRDEAVIA